MINQLFNGDKGLHFVHLNIRSLLAKGKFSTLKAQLIDSNMHVISLSETWLNNKIPMSMLDINGFQLYRLDRQNRNKKRGGGLAMYIDKTLPIDDNKFANLNISNNTIEMQCISVNFLKLREIVIVNLYRPPQGSISSFIEHLTDTITSVFSLCKANIELFFMGDFDMNFSDKNNKQSKELTRLMKTSGIIPLIKDPTRIGEKLSCLDQIFTNSNCISTSGILDINLSDHLAIFCTRKKVKNVSQKGKILSKLY